MTIVMSALVTKIKARYGISMGKTIDAKYDKYTQ